MVTILLTLTSRGISIIGTTNSAAQVAVSCLLMVPLLENSLLLPPPTPGSHTQRGSEKAGNAYLRPKKNAREQKETGKLHQIYVEQGNSSPQRKVHLVAAWISSW